MRSSGLDLPDELARDATRGEIKALLESPELRRIFDDEPAEGGRAGEARGGAGRGGAGRRGATGHSDSIPERGVQASTSRSSRKRRILVGLAPVYLAGLILFFEAVREPALLLEVFGTSSVAEEPAPRAGAAVIAAAAPEPEMQRRMEASQDPAAVEVETIPQDAALPDTVVPDETATRVALADTPAETDSGKAAADLAKRAVDRSDADRPGGEPETASESPPVEVAPEPPFGLVTDARPLPSLAYPDPRAGPLPAVEPIDSAAAEAAEEALRLSRGDRRDVQRRLRFAASDPQMIDGIFGPATRTAIAVWQEQAGLPATGFMDDAAMALLVEQTAEEYRAWRIAERAREREREAQSAVVASSAPPSPAYEPWHGGCKRTASGEIAFGRDVGCNFRAFGSNFKRDLRDLKGNIRELFD